MCNLRSLEGTLSREMGDPTSGHGGFQIADLSDGSQVISYDQKTPRVMASLTKIFTIGAALAAAERDSSPDSALWPLLVKAGHDSHNASAASITKHLGGDHRAAGRRAGVKIVQEHARCRGSSIEIVNGSGLGSNNRCSPAAVTDFLAAMNRAAYRAEFIQALPRAGVDGTLRLRMRNTLASETVRAKTGTLTDKASDTRKPLQDSLAGYVFGRSRTVAFSIMREHAESRYAARAGIDRMVDALAHYCD